MKNKPIGVFGALQKKLGLKTIKEAKELYYERRGTTLEAEMEKARKILENRNLEEPPTDENIWDFLEDMEEDVNYSFNIEDIGREEMLD